MNEAERELFWDFMELILFGNFGDDPKKFWFNKMTRNLKNFLGITSIEIRIDKIIQETIVGTDSAMPPVCKKGYILTGTSSEEIDESKRIISVIKSDNPSTIEERLTEKYFAQKDIIKQQNNEIERMKFIFIEAYEQLKKVSWCEAASNFNHSHAEFLECLKILENAVGNKDNEIKRLKSVIKHLEILGESFSKMCSKEVRK